MSSKCQAMQTILKSFMLFLRGEPANDASELTILVPDKRWPRYRRGSLTPKAVKQLSQGISWPYAAFLIINCSLGAGLLNYASAYNRIGGVTVASIVQLLLLVVIAGTILILVHASELNGAVLYQDVLLTTCGRSVQRLAAISTVLTCYGVCVTMLLIIGDENERIAKSFFTYCTWYSKRSFTLMLTAVFLILPQCYFENLKLLRHAGTLGVVTMIYVVLVNVHQYVTRDTSSVITRKSPESLVSFVSTIPVFAFAFQSHEVVIPVYASMKERTMASFVKVLTLSFAVLIILYFTAGITGYLTFGVEVPPDIMEAYDATNPVVMVALIALILKNITTYPQMAVCGRDSLLGLFIDLLGLPEDIVLENEQIAKILISTGWFFSSLILTIFIPNIGVPIYVLGCVASINVFVFPSLCWMTLIYRSKRSLFTKIVMQALALLMLGVGLFTFVAVILQIINESATGGTAQEKFCK